MVDLRGENHKGSDPKSDKEAGKMKEDEKRKAKENENDDSNAETRETR
jgi:hypothetical protein